MKDLEASVTRDEISWHNNRIFSQERLKRLKELTKSVFLHSTGNLFHSLSAEGKRK